MIKVSTPKNVYLSADQTAEEVADFLHQDEQEFLQHIKNELDQLMREPSETGIQKILAYASLR
ncbi:MAG: hypothetical protein ACKOW2_06395 [Sphingobacteriaceae bacterium]